MTMAEKNKKVAACIAAASVALAGVGVLAYFTDWEKADFQGENGVSIGGNNPVDIVPNDDGKEPDPNNPTDDPTHPKDDNETETPKDSITDEEISDRWARLNATALANYNPGDEIALPVQLYNGGDFGIDVRETFVVTVTGTDREGNALTLNTSDMQFRLRNAVGADGTNYGTFDAADPYDAFDSEDGVDIATENVVGNKATYTLAPHKMDTKEEVIRDYYLVFDKDSLNDFQAAQVTVDYVVEAKQTNAVNGNAGDPSQGWTTIVTESITLGNGATQDVVPKSTITVTP